MSLAQYPKLKESASKIGDQELIDLVAKLEPLLGTDDGKPETWFLPSYMKASMAIVSSTKLSKSTTQYKKHTKALADSKQNSIPEPTITKEWTAKGTEFNRVIGYSNNLFPFVNDEGDTIINDIFERVIELVK